MMNIILTINPDPDGVRCGECKGLDLDESSQSCVFSDELVTLDGAEVVVEIVRSPACLAAEKKLRYLVEAGKMLRETEPARPGESGVYRLVVNDTWDRALAALEKE